ncbi:4-phosphopantoate--beta-alanine ligase [bacterium]|nr:4-phosphopantoate--beta-alanine ligase [bacterium]
MAVKIMTKPAQMQKMSQAWKRQGRRVVLVPTMGALHQGHLALIRRAKKLGDRVVVSSYVNPAQFNSGRDLKKYPRCAAADAALVRRAGADVLFRPAGLYAKNSSTWVEETDCSRGRCGDRRPGHFRGVATVVAKLFHLVQPGAAVFGEKDHQQCLVIERMTRDLHFPVRIVRHPTLRERDGLPLSSRNLRLSPRNRKWAGAWAQALRQAASLGPRRALGAYRKLLRPLRSVRPEYVELVKGNLHAAAWIGGVRLIDHRRCGGSR